MRRLLLALLLTTPLATPLLAREIISTQTQSGYVRTDLIADFCCTAADVAGQADAWGNQLAIHAADSYLGLDAAQFLYNEVRAFQAITAGDVGALTAQTTSRGNAIDLTLCCTLTDLYTTQVASRDAVISAVARASIDRAYGPVVLDALAVANTLGVVADGAFNHTDFAQFSAAGVYAYAVLNGCCAADAHVASHALGNAVALDGLDTGFYGRTVQTNAAPQLRAYTEVTLHAGGDVTAAATATANAIDVNNHGGEAWVSAQQNNHAAVSAESIVTLNGSWFGAVDINAHASGNALTLSQWGGSGGVDAVQTNTGDVSALADVAGGMADSLSVSATAMGNSLTATLCATCDDDSLDGYVSQHNSAHVSASSLGAMDSAGPAHLRAMAVGNSATFYTAPGRR